jgi:deazaflavin-dependent oxidoreductase (nitroreductase family)
MALFGQEHVERYRQTDGAEGHEWRPGVYTLILTTTGRRSGQPRPTPLIYGTHDGDYLVVASKGGSDEPPAWYRNLSENPDVEVQVEGDRFRARARTAGADEKPALWREMAGIWPAYDEYQQRTDRDIPVVVLERVE